MLYPEHNTSSKAALVQVIKLAVTSRRKRLAYISRSAQHATCMFTSLNPGPHSAEP